MPFVQAKCTECGGMLAVDADKKAAVCQFCGEAFIVQEAINNYNTYNTTMHNYGDGAVVNIYEDKNKDFVIEAGILKEYHGESDDVVIPSNVKRIDAICFRDLPIRKITITSDIEKYSLYTTLCCCSNQYALKEVITDGCRDYITENGVVFDSSKTEIIWFSKSYDSDSYHIPDTVEHFASWKHYYDLARGLSKSWCASDHLPFLLKHLYWKNIDLFSLPCNYNRSEIPKSFPRKLKHNFVDYKCTDCGTYDFDSAEYKYFFVGRNGDNSTKAELWFFPNKSVALKKEFGYLNPDFGVDEHIFDKCKECEKVIMFDLHPYNSYNSCYDPRGYHKLLNLFSNAKELIIEEDSLRYKSNYLLNTDRESILPYLPIRNFDKVTFSKKISEDVRKEVWNREIQFSAPVLLEKQKKNVEDRKKNNKCQHCGGEFSFFKNCCKSCGKKKDY